MNAAEPNSPVQGLDQYWAAAETFYDEAYARLRASRDRAWIVTAAFAVLAGLAVLAVVGLVPLKRTDVVPVVVDRSTGEAHIESQLTGQTVSQQEAVRKADLAMYVIARESFDRALVKQYFATVQSRSTDAVLKPWLAQFQVGTPDSVYTRYTAGAVRSIDVHSVVLLGDALGQVHFTATLTKATEVHTEDYIASVGFQYVNAKADLAQRLRNPLGFVVMSYRIDQESLPQEAKP
jgi:type IV secretion system protein VirB8